MKLMERLGNLELGLGVEVEVGVSNEIMRLIITTQRKGSKGVG